MDRRKVDETILVVLVILVLCMICGIVVVPYNIYKNLVYNDNAYNEARATLSGTFYILPQKARLVWNTYKVLLEQNKIQVEVAQARSGIDKVLEDIENAAKAEDPVAAREAANKLGFSVNVLVEAYPQLVGEQTAKDAMREFSEAVNQMISAMDDFNKTARRANDYRREPIPAIVASFFLFPFRYTYYEVPEALTQPFDAEKITGPK